VKLKLIIRLATCFCTHAVALYFCVITGFNQMPKGFENQLKMYLENQIGKK
jgi:hypothetical protein